MRPGPNPKKLHTTLVFKRAHRKPPFLQLHWPYFFAAIFPFVLAARNVGECPEYRHVVPGHPPLCDLSVFDAEHCPEIKLHPAARRWKRSHWSLLRALIRGPCGNEIPLGDQKLDRLDRIG